MKSPRVLALLVALVTGCSSSGEGTFREIALVEMPCSSLDASSEVWESAPFPLSDACGGIDAGPTACCPWLELPGDSTLRIEHGLGRMPRVVDVWISFSELGVGSTIASGDALRLGYADATHLSVENHTEQRFYLRVDLR